MNAESRSEAKHALQNSTLGYRPGERVSIHNISLESVVDFHAALGANASAPFKEQAAPAFGA